MAFQVRYLAIFLFFLNNRRLWMVLDKSLHKNFQLMLEILKAPFLVLHFSYYTLIIFLMILSVILLSLNLNLIYKTLWTEVRNDLLISILGKLCYFHLTSLTKMVILMWKWMSLLLRKNHLLRCWGWPSLLNWIGAIISIAKTVTKEIGALIRSMKFLSPKAALHLYKSTIYPCMEYCCHDWDCVRSC